MSIEKEKKKTPPKRGPRLHQEVLLLDSCGLDSGLDD